MRRNGHGSLGRTTLDVALLGFVGVFMTACIPLPVAAPPVRLSGTFGGGSSGLSAGTPASGQTRGRAVGRLGLSPLSFTKDFTHRVVDPEIGMVFEGLLDPPAEDVPDLGGYIGVAWRVWQQRSGRGGQRLSLRGTGDLMSLRPGDVIGGGGSFAVGWEYTDFFSAAVADNASSLPAFMGYAYGEGGIGFELEGAGRSYGDIAVWQVTIGMTVRVPAFVGILLLPLPLPK